ncbi:MAG: DNA repair protein RecN, partial [Thermoplasmata archaeon]|nr:DNA repair protein RecN [Thermoplasmata archaeon]
DVLAFAEEARSRLATLAAEEERATLMDAEIDAARREVEGAEVVVAEARRRVAPVLAAEIETSLHGLAMPSARFTVRVEGAGSADDVSFELAANPGEPALPLARTASGGELSRTMLALRLALTGSPGLLVFDEVDAGVGGTAAVAVGAALSGLARDAQVVVVTHLAQVAALADAQIAVTKREKGGRTRSEVVLLDGEERVVELSRMLSGSPESDSARRHARELLGTRTGQGAEDGAARS